MVQGQSAGALNDSVECILVGVVWLLLAILAWKLAKSYWEIRNSYLLKYRYPKLTMTIIVLAFATNGLTSIVNILDNLDMCALQLFVTVVQLVLNCLLNIRFILLIIVYKVTMDSVGKEVSLTENRVLVSILNYSLRYRVILSFAVFVGILESIPTFIAYYNSIQDDTLTCWQVTLVISQPFFGFLTLNILALIIMSLTTRHLKENLFLRTEMILNTTCSALFTIVSTALSFFTNDGLIFASLALSYIFYILMTNVYYPLWKFKAIKLRNPESIEELTGISTKYPQDERHSSSIGHKARKFKGMNEIFKNRRFIYAFKLYLSKSLAAESLLFIESVLRLDGEVQIGSSEDELKDSYIALYKEFIAEDSYNCVNVSHQCRNAITLHMKNVINGDSALDSAIYDTAFIELINLIYVNFYEKFLRSIEYMDAKAK